MIVIYMNIWMGSINMIPKSVSTTTKIRRCLSVVVPRKNYWNDLTETLLKDTRTKIQA